MKTKQMFICLGLSIKVNFNYLFELAKPFNEFVDAAELRLET